jgi:hypothetical protein
MGGYMRADHRYSQGIARGLWLEWVDAVQPLAIPDLRGPTDQLLKSAASSLKGGRADLKRLQDFNPRPPVYELGWPGFFAVLAGVTSYLAVVGYAVGYLYLRTYYDRVIPGMNIDYTYSAVLQGLIQKPNALIPLLLPAAYLLARALSTDYAGWREVAGPVVRKLGWVRRHDRVLYWRSLRLRRSRSDNSKQLEEIRESRDAIHAYCQDAVKALPDLYWKSAPLILMSPLRPLPTLLGAYGLLIAVEYGSLLAASAVFRALVMFVPWNPWGQSTKWAGTVVVGFWGLAIVGAGLLAAAVYVSVIATESHYEGNARLIRRRVTLAILVVMMLGLTVFMVARQSAFIDRGFYRIRFPMVAVRTKEAAGATREFGEGTRRQGLDDKSVSGYLVTVGASPDCFMLTDEMVGLSMDDLPYGVVRIPADNLISIQRGYGALDTNQLR